MKDFKYIFICLLSVLFLGACSDEEQDPQQTGGDEGRVKTHTVVLYMMGNNGLEKYMDTNLSRVKSVVDQIPEHGHLVVFYDRGNYTNLTELYVDETTGRVKQRIIDEYVPNRTSSVDPQFMEQVFNKVVTEFPSETYGLIFSSHGGGWVPSDIFDLYLTERGRGTRFFGQDGYECMEIPDLASVLGKFNFEYIIFDACFMASVEAIYDLRETTDHIIASVTAVMGAGFPYRQMIPLLYQNDHGLKQICEEFMKFYKGQSGAISLIDCRNMEALAEQMSRVVANGSEPASVENIQAYEGFRSHIYFDLEQYVEALTSDKKLRADFKKALDKVVTYTSHTEKIYTDYVAEGVEDHYIDLPRSCGMNCHIEQADFPETHEAFLKTAWAKRIGCR